MKIIISFVWHKYRSLWWFQPLSKPLIASISEVRELFICCDWKAARSLCKSFQISWFIPFYHLKNCLFFLNLCNQYSAFHDMCIPFWISEKFIKWSKHFLLATLYDKITCLIWLQKIILFILSERYVRVPTLIFLPP